MMLNGIDHLNIVVEDLERSLNFYQNKLEMKVFARRILEGDWIDKVVGLKNVKARFAAVGFSEKGIKIELLQYLNPLGKKLEKLLLPNCIGLRHLAFRVKDIEQRYQKLLNKGVIFISPPIVVPGNQKKLCYFRDPDGVILELAEYHQEN